MSDVVSTTVVDEKPAKSRRKGKSAKPTKPKQKVASSNGKLAKGQIRILAALAKSGEPMFGDTLYKKAKLASRAWLSEYLGRETSANDGYIMKGGKPTSIRKLIPAGLVRTEVIGKNGALDDNPKTAYHLTAAGKKSLAKHSG